MKRFLVMAAWLGGLVTMWLGGCNPACLFDHGGQCANKGKSCVVNTECGESGWCYLGQCSAIPCEEGVLRKDPKTGACVAISACDTSSEQGHWERCDQDPCAGLSESPCLADARCQPAYTSRDLSAGKATPCSTQGGAAPTATVKPDGSVATPGVNLANQPKHGDWSSACWLASTSRTYAGCRAVPQSIFIGELKNSCESNSKQECLVQPTCQAVGTPCYCPPGATCDCQGGAFLYCETNDRLRRCTTNADCNAGERCDNDEDCIIPRTFASLPPAPPKPGDRGCTGACVPVGCTGDGEQQCNADLTCDGGDYNSTCSSPIYYLDGMLPPCSNQFIGCAPQSRVSDLRTDRSLLVRDPEIVDDPAFSLLSVLAALAPPGQVDAFAQSLLSQLGAGKQFDSGAMTQARVGASQFYHQLDDGTPLLAQRFSAMMATTALINRLDLATTHGCGEARLSFAMTSAYENGSQRMTLIVELKVPDDGAACQTVARRWAELSGIEDPQQRREKLIVLFGELLKPAHLGQIRTNEFINRTGKEAWELREFHLRAADGLLELAPVAQTIDPKVGGLSALLSWLSDNSESIQAGTAIVPVRFLAGASTEDGSRLDLVNLADDAKVSALSGTINRMACAGCHLTETGSPFVHIGERLATRVDGVFRPTGRAVIDDFLKKELANRAAVLQGVLTGSPTGPPGPPGLVSHEWRPLVQARVH
jgi:hypothetical protein